MNNDPRMNQEKSPSDPYDFEGNMTDAPAFRGEAEKLAHNRPLIDVRTEVLEPGVGQEIPANSQIPKGVALDNLSEYLESTPSFVINSVASQMADKYKIKAIISAENQPFWIVDVRGEKGFNIPFILFSPTHAKGAKDGIENNANLKGIRPTGRPEMFGRIHNYGDRFSFDPKVSREHFGIRCGKDENLAIADLHSTNGTTVITGVPSEIVTDNIYYNSILIDGHPHPILRGIDMPTNGAIEAGYRDGMAKHHPDILIDGDSPEMEQAYQKLLLQMARNPEKFSSGDTQEKLMEKLNLVKEAVGRILRYDVAKTNDLSKSQSIPFKDNNHGGERRLISLSDYVRNHHGDSRQQSLLAACLLEKMKDDRLIDGDIFYDKDGLYERIAPEWAVLQISPEEDIIVDVSQNYVGPSDNAHFVTTADLWRPEHISYEELKQRQEEAAKHFLGSSDDESAPYRPKHLKQG